ncbi:hypothetical protein NQZ79_g1983 [Umbelopsis isabellina]|nr:hypothetical protein NQZ79_g1983 [Umbelopsis isabellina]
MCPYIASMNLKLDISRSWAINDTSGTKCWQRMEENGLSNRQNVRNIYLSRYHKVVIDILALSEAVHSQRHTTVLSCPGLLQKNPQVYRSLVQSAEMMGSHNEHRNIIEQAMLLLCMEDEEQVFWVMVITTSHILPSNTYDITMEGASVDQLTLLWLIFDKFPDIWSRISNDVPFWELEQYERPPPSTLVTTHWFLTLFANVLPPEASPLSVILIIFYSLAVLIQMFLFHDVKTVFRVWDIFFFEGHVVLFRVALAILDLNSEALLNAEDAMEIFQIMQVLPKQAIDCNQLLDAAFGRCKLVADITSEEIQHRTQIMRERRRRRRYQTL